VAFDRQSDGHVFDLVYKKCERCGMTRENYEERGKLPCSGRPDPRQADRHDLIPLPDDPLDNDH
jgi:hypothetical protein